MRRMNWIIVFLLAATVINYPNPFNPGGGEVATIECTADATAEAFLYIYNMSAQLLLRKAFDLRGGTAVSTTWDGYSDFNELVGSGVYLYQIVDSSKSRVGKGKIWVINR